MSYFSTCNPHNEQKQTKSPRVFPRLLKSYYQLLNLGAIPQLLLHSDLFSWPQVQSRFVTPLMSHHPNCCTCPSAGNWTWPSLTTEHSQATPTVPS